MLAAALLAALAVEAAGAHRGRTQELRGRLGLAGPRRGYPVGLLGRTLWLLDQPWFSESNAEDLVWFYIYSGVMLDEGAGDAVGARAVIMERIQPRVSRFDPLIPWLGREIARGMLSWDDRPAAPDQHPDAIDAVHAAQNLGHLVDWFHDAHPNLMDYALGDAIDEANRWMRRRIQARIDEAADIDHMRREDLRLYGVTDPVTVASWPDGASIVRLVTPTQLEEEGQRMSHCVGSYWRNIADGSMAVFSYRDPTGKPRVTLALELPTLNANLDDDAIDSGEHLYPETVPIWDFEGFANGVITDPVAAERMMAWLASWEGVIERPRLQAVSHVLPDQVYWDFFVAIPVRSAALQGAPPVTGARGTFEYLEQRYQSARLERELAEAEVVRQIEGTGQRWRFDGGSRLVKAVHAEADAFRSMLGPAHDMWRGSLAGGQSDMAYEVQDGESGETLVQVFYRHPTALDVPYGWWAARRADEKRGLPASTVYKPLLASGPAEALQRGGSMVTVEDWHQKFSDAGAGVWGQAVLLPQAEFLAYMKRHPELAEDGR